MLTVSDDIWICTLYACIYLFTYHLSIFYLSIYWFYNVITSSSFPFLPLNPSIYPPFLSFYFFSNCSSVHGYICIYIDTGKYNLFSLCVYFQGWLFGLAYPIGVLFLGEAYFSHSLGLLVSSLHRLEVSKFWNPKQPPRISDVMDLGGEHATTVLLNPYNH